MDDEFHEEVQVPLRDGNVILVRISRVLTTKVGPGPRPRRGETMLVQSHGDQLLTVSIDSDELAGAVVVGGGGPPVVER